MATLAAPSRSRKQDILAAAEQEFAAAGFSGGRIERIAASAAVNKQLLFYYFDSKEGLFRSALAELLARCEPPAVSPDQPAEDIRRVLTALQSAVRALPGILGIVADSEANADFPRAAADDVRVWRTRQLDRLRTAIEDGQRRGYFRDDLDPATVARVALAAALGSGALPATPQPMPLAALIVDHCAWR